MARAGSPLRRSRQAAAVAVLKGKRVGLPTKEIVAAVLNTKGVSLKGATPGQTIAAILATSNRNSVENPRYAKERSIRRCFQTPAPADTQNRNLVLKPLRG